MTKKAASKKAALKKRPTPPETSPVIPPLRTLLHTLRCIAQHEDALCTLLHNLQNHPEQRAELTTELHTLLDHLPARDYIDDLNAVVHALSETAQTPPPAIK